MLKTTASLLPFCHAKKGTDLSLVNLASLQLALPFPTSAIQKPPKLILHFILREISYYVVFFQGMTLLIRIIGDLAENFSLEQPELLAVSLSENSVQIYKDFDIQLNKTKEMKQEIMRIIYYILIIYLEERKELPASNSISIDDKFYLENKTKKELEAPQARKPISYQARLALTFKETAKLCYEKRLALKNHPENQCYESILELLRQFAVTPKKNNVVTTSHKGSALNHSPLKGAKNKKIAKLEKTKSRRKCTQKAEVKTQAPINDSLKLLAAACTSQFALVPYRPIKLPTLPTIQEKAVAIKSEIKKTPSKEVESRYMASFLKYNQAITHNPAIKLEDNHLNTKESALEDNQVMILKKSKDIIDGISALSKYPTFDFQNYLKNTTTSSFSQNESVCQCPSLSGFNLPTPAFCYPKYRFSDLKDNSSRQTAHYVNNNQDSKIKQCFDLCLDLLKRSTIPPVINSYSTITVNKPSLPITIQTQPSNALPTYKPPTPLLALPYEKKLLLTYPKILALTDKPRPLALPYEKKGMLTYPKIYALTDKPRLLALPYEKKYALPYEQKRMLTYPKVYALTDKPRVLALPYEKKYALPYEKKYMLTYPKILALTDKPRPLALSYEKKFMLTYPKIYALTDKPRLLALPWEQKQIQMLTYPKIHALTWEPRLALPYEIKFHLTWTPADEEEELEQRENPNEATLEELPIQEENVDDLSFEINEECENEIAQGFVKIEQDEEIDQISLGNEEEYEEIESNPDYDVIIEDELCASSKFQDYDVIIEDE